MEKTLKLNLCDAKKLYPNAPSDFKKQLEGAFGRCLLLEKVTDRIKTIEDACNEICTGIPTMRCGETVDEFAYRQLKIITKALNEGWEPNWDNSNEYKYYPWFKMGCRDSGFGFSTSDCDSWGTVTSCGSRLCFKSRELSEYAGKQFEDIYKQFLK